MLDAKDDWETFKLIAGFGAEGVRTPLILPAGRAIIVPEGQQWLAAAHLIDLIGEAGTYDQQIYLRYNITYSVRIKSDYETSCPNKFKSFSLLYT